MRQAIPIRTALMWQDYAEGMTFQAVGEKYGVTRERVRQLFADVGLPTRTREEERELRLRKQATPA